MTSVRINQLTDEVERLRAELADLGLVCRGKTNYHSHQMIPPPAEWQRDEAAAACAESHKYLRAFHASAPNGMKCADCTMNDEPCPVCYESWWKKLHPNVVQLTAATIPLLARLEAAERVADRLAEAIRRLLPYQKLDIGLVGKSISGNLAINLEALHTYYVYRVDELQSALDAYDAAKDGAAAGKGGASCS